MNSASALIDVDTTESTERRRETDFGAFQSTEDSGERKQPRARAPVSLLYPLSTLGQRQLARPIVVTVEAEVDSVIMNSPKLRIWGSGSDVYAAFSDFVNTFEDVLASYSDTRPEQLTEGARRYLGELQSYIG